MARSGSPILVTLILCLGVACSAEQASDESAAAPPEKPSGAETIPTGEADPALASQGATLFQTRGCIGCHTIGGGRLTGPDLQGVTERREAGWIMAMIVNPDSMLKVDPEARKLFAEYMTPMLSMGLTRDEARAIYEHLRQQNP